MPIFKLTQTTGGGGYMAIFNGDAKEIVEFGSTDNESGYMRINDRNSKNWPGSPIRRGVVVILHLLMKAMKPFAYPLLHQVEEWVCIIIIWEE